MERETLDSIDLRILRQLVSDGRKTITALSKEVGISKTPCQARVKRLERDGYIKGYRAILNPAKLNLEHIAFVEIKLKDTTAKALNAFNAAVTSILEIEQCHMIAGGFDYLLKVRTADITDYRRVLGEVISALPYVAQSSTYVAMETVKDEGAITP